MADSINEVVSKQAYDQVERLNTDLLKLISNLEVINSVSKKFNLPSGASRAINNANQSKQQSNALDKEAQRLTAALERQKAKLKLAQGKVNQELIKYRFETQQANREAKQQAIISSRLSTEYQKQQARINLLSNRYRDLATKQQLGVKLSKQEERELKDVTRQLERKQRALKKVDANMGVFNRNVGNYKSAWKGVSGLLMASVGAFGAFAAIDIAKDIFNDIKEINSLNAALKQVTNSTYEFTQAQDFLRGVAYTTGIEINDLQRSYTKFYAAAKNTNLSLKETQNIFRQVSKAGASLGLSTEQVNGALTALEQMLSKGKVQAEEIRGQLGERLPGAFQILAKSMGKTTAELDQMLKDGEVIADEVLPRFADQLEITFGLDKVQKIDTLTAAQGRLSNAWNEFIRTLDSGDGVISQTLRGMLNAFTTKLSLINVALMSSEERAERIRAVGISKDIERDLETVSKLSQMFVKESKTLGNTMDSNQAKILAAQQLIEGYNNENNRMLDDLGIWNKAEREKRDLFIEQKKALEQYIAGLEAKDETEKKSEKTGKAQKVLIKGTIAWYQSLIKELQRLQNEVDTTSEAWAQHQYRIDTLQKGIAKLKGTLEDFPSMGVEEFIKGVDQDQLTADLEAWAAAANSARERDLKAEEEFQKKKMQLIGEGLQRIADMYGVDASKFEFLYDGKLNTVEDYADAAGEVLKGLNNALTQSELRNVNAQIEANREKYDYLIQQAEGNEQQQELLRQEAARKEKALLEKRAKVEKRAAIFESVINTSTAVVKALASAPPPANFGLAATVGALGAVQTALIAAQPLPQYKRGRKGGKEEMAILGDGYKNEPIIDKDGNLKDISPNKPTVMHLDKGDSVLPSMQDLMRSSVMTSLDSAKGYDANKAFEQRLGQMMKSYNKDVIKSLRKANFVNNNNVNVDLGFEFKKKKYS